MKRRKAKTLAGFMELSPSKQVLFNKMKETIQKTFELNGLTPMDTPVLEYSSVLLAKAGGETEKQIYRFEKSDADVCMRFDLTVPFAKYVALYENELNFPFRRYQIGKVYRGERAQKGRLREFYQCDMDIIDKDSLDISADAECIDVLSQVFENLGYEIIIRVNNRKVVSGLLEELNLQASASEILNILDKKDKIGRAKTAELLSAHSQNYNKLIDFFEIKSTDKLRELNFKNEKFLTGLAEIEKLFEILKMKNTKAEVVFDFGIIRGLDYYTGTVFEANLKNVNERVSVGGGGRYENLASYFTEQNFCGVGVSVGLSRLFDILDKNSMLEFSQRTTTKVALIPFDDTLDYAFSLEKFLKVNDIPTETVYYINKSFKKKMSYVDKKQIPYLIVIGGNEVQGGVFELKNMKTGEVKKLDKNAVVKELKNI